MIGDVVADVFDIAFDQAGEIIVRNELLVLTLDRDLSALEQLSGWRELQRERLPRFSATLVRLLVPQYQALDEALADVRRLLPEASIDYNHGYELEQQSLDLSDQPSKLAGGRYLPIRSPDASRLRIGIIDSGIADDHESLRSSAILKRSFLSDDQMGNLSHGTAVASLITGHSSSIQGAIPDAQLIAAEAFFEAPALDLVSTGFQLVQSLDWLAGENVNVINMSLAGPSNQVLEKAIQFISSSGIIIVAASGNDGPASAPRYPAAYPDVLAVTAIDANNRPFLRAVRGPHLDFAAPGVAVTVADSNQQSAYRVVSGTSFAAPFVSALVLHYQRIYPGAELTELKGYMQSDVIDLGSPGRDNIYGWGLSGASLMPGRATDD